MKLNEAKIRYIIRKMDAGMSTRNVGEDVKISHERARQIYRLYKQSGEIPSLKKVGRPKMVLLPILSKNY